MQIPDLAGRELSDAERILDSCDLNYSVEVTGPPRDRRSEEEKERGAYRVLRVDPNGSGSLKLLVCRV